jgi:hypothetical protein
LLPPITQARERVVNAIAALFVDGFSQGNAHWFIPFIPLIGGKINKYREGDSGE